MAASDFFRDVGTAIFKPVGDFVGGAVTALQPGRVQQMREFAESQRIQDLLRKAQTDSLKNKPTTKIQEYMAEGYTSDEATMIRDIHFGKEPRASSRLTYDKMTNTEKMKYLLGLKTTAEGQYFGIEGGNVEPRDPNVRAWAIQELEKLPQYRGQKRQGFLGREESEFPAGFPPTAKPTGLPAVEEPPEVPEEVVSKRKEVGLAPMKLDPKEKAAYKKVLDIWERLPQTLRLKMMSLRGADFAWEEIIAIKELTPYLGKPMGLPDYFSEEVPIFEDLPQAATPDFPEENIPRTFEQLGIVQPQDQQIFQEMQKALPDVDMRQEYENNPESFKRLMKLWQDRKVNKKNLRQFFSAIQQKAKQSLGIA